MFIAKQHKVKENKIYVAYLKHTQRMQTSHSPRLSSVFSLIVERHRNQRCDYFNIFISPRVTYISHDARSWRELEIKGKQPHLNAHIQSQKTERRKKKLNRKLEN